MAKLKSGKLGGLRRLNERVRNLEDEVQECRQLNLRLAELIDVVEQLLVPLAANGDAETRAALTRFHEAVGGPTQDPTEA